MRISLAITTTCLVLIQPLSAQSPESQRPTPPKVAEIFDVKGVRLKSIRRVQKSAALNGRPGVEIVLHNPEGFYIGGLDWVLHIGEYQFHPLGGEYGPHTRTYTLTMKQWKKLKDGDPLNLTWGGFGRRENVPPTRFALLNKKMIKRR